MKRIVSKILLVILTLFLFAGISYAHWTDRVDILVNAGTAETELEITSDFILKGSNQNIILQSSKNVETIKVLNLDDKGVKVALIIKNTGTIPVHIDYIRFYDFDTSKSVSKIANDINIINSLYKDGNTVLYSEEDFSKISNGKSVVKIKPSHIVRLEPGEEATLHLTLYYDKNISNENGNNENSSNGNSNNENGSNGKGKGQDKDKNNSLENISFGFSLEVSYSRFNE